eukprot:s251_g16.t1
MGLPPESVTRVRRACYGLVDAPLEWYRSVYTFFQTLGLQRCWSDPCCWKLVVQGELKGLISGHVDDFLFSGCPTDPIWSKTIAAIQKEYRWSDWEQGKFTQCGVLIEAQPDGSYLLSQEQYVEELKYIPIRAHRKRERNSPTDDFEKSQLRTLLGGIRWHAQQVAPHFSAEVSVLLSEVTKSTVETLFRANKLIDQVKNMKGHKMVIHKIPPENWALFAWADAASQNRPDGGSTQGIVIGLATEGLLRGECEPVSILAWHSSKIARVCTSPGSSEAFAAVNAEDLLCFCRFQVAEMRGFPVDIRHPNEVINSISGCLISDSRNVYNKVSSEVLCAKGAERRVDLTLMRIKESQQVNQVIVRWVHSDAQLANSLTKGRELRQLLLFYDLGHVWRIVEDPSMASARRRKEQGLEPLEGDVVGVRRRHGDWLELVQDCEVRFKKRESPEQPITAVNPLRRHKDGKRRSKSGAQTAWMMVEHPELGQLMRRARKRKGGLGSGCVLSPERLQMYQEVVELCHRRIYKENLESLWDGEAEKLPTLETIECCGKNHDRGIVSLALSKKASVKL